MRHRCEVSNSQCEVKFFLIQRITHKKQEPINKRSDLNTSEKENWWFWSFLKNVDYFWGIPIRCTKELFNSQCSKDKSKTSFFPLQEVFSCSGCMSLRKAQLALPSCRRHKNIAWPARNSGSPLRVPVQLCPQICHSEIKIDLRSFENPSHQQVLKFDEFTGIFYEKMNPTGRPVEDRQFNNAPHCEKQPLDFRRPVSLQTSPLLRTVHGDCSHAVRAGMSYIVFLQPIWL